MYLKIHQTYQENLFIRESVFEHERKKSLKLRNSALNDMVIEIIHGKFSLWKIKVKKSNFYEMLLNHYRELIVTDLYSK